MGTVDSPSLKPVSYLWDKDVLQKALSCKLMATNTFVSTSSSLDIIVFPVLDEGPPVVPTMGSSSFCTFVERLGEQKAGLLKDHWVER